MLRTFSNLFRSILYLAMGGLVGYYSFESGGIVNVLTNVFFFALGILMVASWQTKKQSEPLSEDPSLSVQATDANVVEDPDMTDKTEPHILHD